MSPKTSYLELSLSWGLSLPCKNKNLSFTKEVILIVNVKNAHNRHDEKLKKIAMVVHWWQEINKDNLFWFLDNWDEAA